MKKRVLALTLLLIIMCTYAPYANATKLIDSDDYCESEDKNVEEHIQFQIDDPLLLEVSDGNNENESLQNDEEVALMSSDEASGVCGNNLTWEFDGDSTLVISGTGQMYNYSYDDLPWYNVRENIKKVIISNGVTGIGDYAFYGCENLIEAEIPEGVGSIGSYAFNNCGLTDITIPASLKSISNNAFNACEELTSVHISDLTSWCNITFGDINSNPLRYAQNLYLNNQLVTKLTLPSDVSVIKSYAFVNCTSMTSVEFHSNITQINKGAFDGCTNLKGVYIDDLSAWCNISFEDGGYSYNSNPLEYAGNLYINNVLVTNMTIPSEITEINPYVFQGCTSLTKVNIPNGVTSIEDYAFADCKQLDNITIPEGVKSIGEYAFYGCGALKNVILPQTLETIGSRAFSGCSSLSEVAVPDSVTSIDRYAFSNCVNLKKITLGDYITSISSSVFQGCTALEYIEIPNSVKSIDDRAFYGCSALEEMEIPSNVESIGDYVFSECTSLSAVNVDYGNMSYSSQDGVLFDKNKTELIYYPLGRKGGYSIPYGVSVIADYAFYYSAVTDILIPNTVTNIGEWAFGYCLNLMNIDIPNSVENIGYASFSNCINLKSIELHEGLLSIDSWAFQYCTSLEKISIPDSVISMDWPTFSYCESLSEVILGTGITEIGARTFEYCSSLQNVEMRGNITNIGDSAFDSCTQLKTFEIPQGVTEIASSTFRRCSSLTDIKINENITRIEGSAFYDCDMLEQILIPSSVTYIGSGAFDSCDGLRSIDVDSGNGNYCSQNGILFDKDITTLIKCPGGKAGEITLPASVTNINDSFGNHISAIHVENGNVNYTSEDGVLYNYDKTQLIRYPGGRNGEYTIPSTVIDISDGALAGDGLKSVTILNTDAIDWNIMFRECTGLTTINIPEDNSDYTSLDGVMFNKDLTELICYPRGKSGMYTIPEGVKEISGYAFYGNDNLTKVQIPDSVTFIGYYAFSWCTALQAIDMPDSITEVEAYAFCGCENLTDIKISKGLTSIDMDVFQNIGAETVVIPDGITTIELGAFSFCDNLKNIVLPDSITNIASWAFQDDTALTDIFYAGSKEQWSNIYISARDNEYFTHATVHYNAIGAEPPKITNAIVFPGSDASIGNSVQVTLEDTEYDSTMITAFYKDGVMVDMQTTPISAGDITEMIPISDLDADTANVFIWSSLDSMQPLCEAKNIQL